MVTAALLTVTAVAVAVASLADRPPAAAASPSAKPKWLIIPGFWPNGTGAEVVGSVSGRGWIGFARGDGDSRSTLLGSLRRRGGSVSFTRTVLTTSRGPMTTVGSQLFCHLPGGTQGELRRVPMFVGRPPWTVEEITVVRGDARGSHARRVSAAAPAPFGANSPFQWQPPILAAFVPDGLVFFKLYHNFRELDQTRVLAGLLPVAY